MFRTAETLCEAGDEAIVPRTNIRQAWISKEWQRQYNYNIIQLKTAVWHERKTTTSDADSQAC